MLFLCHARIGRVAILLTATVGLIAGCTGEPSHSEYVARVGDQYLREADITDDLEALPAGTDSVSARHQIIDQWTTDALLYREARRLDLDQEEHVRKQLEDSKRSVMINAFLDRLYDEAKAKPTLEEIRTYFQEHREELSLNQPHVQVRYLATADEQTAQKAHQQLRRATRQGTATSLWPGLINGYATNTARARQLSDSYWSERDLFTGLPEAQQQLSRLEAGQLAPVFDNGGIYHVLQLVDRAPAGTLPKLEWVEGQVRKRLAMEQRKQMYERQVKRLESQARSRGILDAPQ